MRDHACLGLDNENNEPTMAGCLKQGRGFAVAGLDDKPDCGLRHSHSSTWIPAASCRHPMNIRISESLKFVNSKNCHSTWQSQAFLTNSASTDPPKCIRGLDPHHPWIIIGPAIPRWIAAYQRTSAAAEGKDVSFLTGDQGIGIIRLPHLAVIEPLGLPGYVMRRC